MSSSPRSFYLTETEATTYKKPVFILSLQHDLCWTCNQLVCISLKVLVGKGECGLALFFGQSHCFHSARQAQLIKVTESISSSNANHVWATYINGGALLTPCCRELCRAFVLQSHVTAGMCYFWKLGQFQRSSRSRKALWKQLYRKNIHFACHPAHISTDPPSGFV